MGYEKKDVFPPRPAMETAHVCSFMLFLIPLLDAQGDDEALGAGTATNGRSLGPQMTAGVRAALLTWTFSQDTYVSKK